MDGFLSISLTEHLVDLKTSIEYMNLEIESMKDLKVGIKQNLDWAEYRVSDQI